MRKKIRISTVINGLILILFLVLLSFKIPTILSAYKAQGNFAAGGVVYSLEQSQINVLSGTKKILIFWATWCKPCELELMRINRMVKNNEISKNQVLAIAISEDFETVRSEVVARDYKFNVAIDANAEVASKYGVQGTPTIVFIDSDQKVNWMSTGISPSLEIRIKTFLD